MFSLIVVILAIALVALLTAATMYYVGSTATESQTRAQAATYINQGQQLLAATQAFYAQKLRLPDDINELVTEGFLRSVPEVVAHNTAPRFEFIASAYAQSTPHWSQVATRTAIYWVRQAVTTDVCRAVNLQSRGDDGIYEKARPRYSTQCYGTAAPYTVLVAQSSLGPQITDVLPPGEVEPGDTEPPWAVPPSTTPASTPPSAPPPLTLTASPSLVDFDSVPVGTTVNVTVTVTNTGTSPVTISGVTATSPVSLTTTCGGALAPSANCVIDLTYTGTGAEPVTGSISVAAASGALTIPWLAGPDWCYPSDTVTCGLHLSLGGSISGFAGGTYGPMEGTVTNYTGIPQTLSALQVHGTDFTQTTYADIDGYGYAPCTVGMTLNDGESCGVAVNFTPQDAGTRSAYFTVRSTQGESATVRLEGYATPAEVHLVLRDALDNLLDSKYEVGNRDLWMPMAFLNNPVNATFTIRNEGSLAADNLNISVPAPFAVQSSTCGTSLPAGSQCSVTLSYSPGYFDGIRVRTASIDWAGRTLATPLRIRLFGRSTSSGSINTAAPPAYAFVMVPTTEGRPLTSADSTVFSAASPGSGSYNFTVNPANTYTSTHVYVIQVAGSGGMGAMQISGGAENQYVFIGRSPPRQVIYGTGYYYDEIYRCSSGYMADGTPCQETIRFTTPVAPGDYTTTFQLYEHYGTPELGYTVTLTGTRP